MKRHVGHNQPGPPIESTSSGGLSVVVSSASNGGTNQGSTVTFRQHKRDGEVIILVN